MWGLVSQNFCFHFEYHCKIYSLQRSEETYFPQPWFPIDALEGSHFFTSVTLQTKDYRWHLQCSLTSLVKIALEICQEEIHG